MAVESMDVDCDNVLVMSARENRRIRTIQLKGDNGCAFFDTGFVLDFTPKTMKLLEHYKCDTSVRIDSHFGSRAFEVSRPTDNGRGPFTYWQSLFADTKQINFHGTWEPDFLKFMISQLTLNEKIDILSFTYWKCERINGIMKVLLKQRIRELSMHIGHDQADVVMDSFRTFDGTPSIKRLMLVFDDPFIDIRHLRANQNHVERVLLPPHANNGQPSKAILLFGGESDGAKIESLTGEGYEYDRHIKMATNELYSDDSLDKYYETYEVYGRVELGVNWLVGSLLGKYAPRPFEYSEPEGHLLRMDPSPTVTVLTSFADGKNQMVYNGHEDGKLKGAAYSYWTGLGVYTKSLKRQSVGGRELREFAYDEAFSREKAFKIPGWYETRIQKVIYHDFGTEYLTSNGFYYMLESMGQERVFHNRMITTKHLTLESTSQLRRCFIFENIRQFFRNTEHIEFVGVWGGRDGLAGFLTRLDGKITAITMVRIHIHTNSALIFTLRLFPDELVKSLRRFHYDGRATADYSIASIVNAFWKREGHQHFNLDELIIAANALQDRHDNMSCRMRKHCDDMASFLSENGSSSTLIGSPIALADLYEGGFAQPQGQRSFANASSPVMASISYPFQRLNDTLPTRLMRGYEREFGKKMICLVVPVVFLDDLK